MKLYPILFEAATPPPLPITKKTLTSYTAPDFALFVYEDAETRLVLVHTNSLLDYLSNPDGDVPFEDICAAMIECEERGSDCLGVMQVTLAAGSPKWKGAGISIYGIASNYFGAPLISDRDHSSSVASRETWAKIEKSSEWTKAGEGLDNYAKTPKGNIYVDIEGTYPKRLAEPRIKQDKKLSITSFKDITPDKTFPKTSTTVDDCPLPSKGGFILDPEEMADLVGTADAYRYTGPLNAEPLVKQGEKLLQLTRDAKVNPKGIHVKEVLLTMSTELFKSRYRGSETAR